MASSSYFTSGLERQFQAAGAIFTVKDTLYRSSQQGNWGNRVASTCFQDSTATSPLL